MDAEFHRQHAGIIKAHAFLAKHARAPHGRGLASEGGQRLINRLYRCSTDIL